MGFEPEAQALNYRAGGRGRAPGSSRPRCHRPPASRITCAVPGSQRPCPVPQPPGRKIKAAVLQENKGQRRREGGARPPHQGGGACGCPIFSLPCGLRTLGFSDATGRGQAGSRSPLVNRAVLAHALVPPSSHLPLGAGLRVWSLTMPAESL